MNAITDFRTVYIPAVLPPKVAKPILRPERSFAEQARLDNAAVSKSWDQQASKYNNDKSVVDARRLEWVAMLPATPFGRTDAAEVWGVAGGSADSRLEVMERHGLIKRVAVKPIQWERAQ